MTACKKLIIPIIFSLLPAFLYPINFDSFQALYTLETAHFKIIFSDESRPSASRLAAMADDIYREVSQSIGSSADGKIPVMITSDYDVMNGYYTSFPYDMIAIYDYPSDFDQFLDLDLRLVFKHELTHALSLTIMHPFWRSWNHIFGNYVMPSDWMIPNYMTEGTAVSFESLDGRGRVNDPMVGQRLKQQILEGRFKNPGQVSGGYDLSGGGDDNYWYGALFNHYIQEKYGWDKYRLFWKNLGIGDIFYGVPGEFEGVYGTNLDAAWTQFKDSIRFHGTIETNTNSLPIGSRYFENPISWKGKIIFIDTFENYIKMFDTQNRQVTPLMESANTHSITVCGDILVLNQYYTWNGFPKLMTRFYDLTANTFLPEILFGYDSVVIFNRQKIALKPHSGFFDLVMIEDGKENLLLAGNSRLKIGSPVKLNAYQAVMLVLDDNVSKVVLYDLTSRDFTEAVFQNQSLKFMHFVQADHGQILFSYNSDYSFFKMAAIQTNVIFIQTNNLSGGVFNPVPWKDGYLYRGIFSGEDRLLVLNKPAGEFQSLSWKPFQRPQSADTNPDLKQMPKPYNPLEFMLPKLWLPSVTYRDNLLNADSFNINTISEDPAEINIFTYSAGYNWVKPFANLNVNWENHSLPLTLNFSAGDKMVYFQGANLYAREASAAGNAFFPIYPIPADFIWYFDASFNCYAFALDNGISQNPYEWKFGGAKSIAGLSTGIDAFHGRGEGIYTYRGFSLSAAYDYSLFYGIYKTEFSFSYAPFFLPSRVNLYCALSDHSFFTLYSSSAYFPGNRYPSYFEYSSVGRMSWYYLSGEYNFPLFDLEIQNSLWIIYFRRIFMNGGYRCAYLDSSYYQSVYSRFYVEFSLNIGSLIFNNIQAFAEGFYRINRNDFGYLLNIGRNF